VIDGFRVHPDPGDDGVIRVFEGDKVVVNATDIASPQSFLVVTWGDGANKNVGCGPCRADHTYAPGRYTLTARADNLPPSTGTAADRSISVTVEVSPVRETLAPIQPFELSTSDIGVGDTTYLKVPIFLPAEVDLSGVSFDCSPSDAAFPDFGNEIFDPPNVAVPFVGASPGACSFAVAGFVNGVPFRQVAKFRVH